MKAFPYALMLTLLGLASQLYAQDDRYSQQDVDLQGLFIEAGREKLLGKYAEAEALYKKVIAQDKENHAAHYELARVMAEQNKDEEALEAVQKAAELDANNVWYKVFLAEQYQKMGRDADGAKIYEALVKRHPDNEEYYYKWAFYLVRAGEPVQAVKVYDNLEARIGISEEIVRRKHTLYLGTGDNRKAAQELERLIQAFPDNTEYYHLLAGFYEQMNEPDKARDVYKQILQLNPEDAKAKIAVAGAARQQSGGGQAAFLNSLKPIFQNSGVGIDVKIKEILPLIQQVSNSNDQALAEPLMELTSILVQVHPDEAKAFAAHGDLLYHSNRKEEAAAAYEKTLELDENVFSVWEQLMYLYVEEQQFDKLLKTSEAAMDVFPNQAKVYYMNGIGQTEKGNYDEATDVLNQALLMSGRDGRLQFDIYTQLGKAHNGAKQYAESNEAFENALKLNPDGIPALDAYSYALAQREQELPKAEQMAAKINKLLPNKPEYEDTYAWVLYKQKDYKKARHWMEQALSHGGTNQPRLLEHYGDVLFQLGETDKALEQWQKAQALGSKSESLEKKIAERKVN